MNARGTKHEARLLVMAMMAVCSSVALAMPTQQELKKAQPLVAELMAPIMDDFKAKKKTAAEVADAAVKYADEAETEAAKFMLYRSSIPYYVRGEAYDKAADAVEQLKASVKDVPASVIEEIISKATVRANREKAPRLFELYQQAKTQATAEKDVKELCKKAASLANKRKLAEALATTGNWQEALKEFASLTDQTAQMAKGEQDGSAKSAALGEFWWAYKPTYENAEDTFKIHAAVHYRKALAAGEITGLKKPIVEQRIKELVVAVGGKDVVAATASSTSPIETKTGTSDTNPVGKQHSVATENAGSKQGKSIVIALKTGVEFDFVYCPKGSFMMGKGGDNDIDSCTRNHKVTFTRPFWMSKTQVTRAQWDAFMKPRGSFYQKQSDQRELPVSFVTYQMANEYCHLLNRRFKSKLPSGYVIRLPTEAEWEYALTAGTDDFNDPYIMFRDGSLSERREISSKISVTRADIENNIVPIANDFYRKKFEAKENVTPWLRHYVARKLPNNWGMYDMMGNGAEIMLDIVRHKAGRENRIEPIAAGEFQYQEEEVDPLRMVDDHEMSSSVCVVRGVASSDRFSPDWNLREGVPLDIEYNGQTFRLVIGPDLVSEWKAKNGKK